ncbi:MAG: chromate transporter [Eubacteriales bacterium]|nr:chromate transporter [Eubacteriales bacterium]
MSILLQLFFSFLKVGLFSVGGGYAAIPLIESQVVDAYHWLSMNEFTDLVTIAEMTPGPIAINSATFVGIRIAGLPGALTATFGCIVPSCILVSVLAFIYRKYNGAPAVDAVLQSLRPAVVALVAGAGLSILKTALTAGAVSSGAHALFSGISLSALLLFCAAFFLLQRFRLNPILVMCLCGAANLLLHL